MSKSSASGMKASEHDHQVTSLAEWVGYSHPDMPKEILEEIAEDALAKTEDAPIQGFRMPLAQHDVTGQAMAWERSHDGGGH